MRRRDFTIGLLLATAVRTVQAQERGKQRRIAIVIPAGAVAIISETSSDLIRLRFYQGFFGELRRLGDVEGQNLTIERYSGEGRPEGFADLAREVVGRSPDVIVAQTNPVALAVRAATGTIPIVWVGVNAIGVGLVTSLARPGGNITGVSLYDAEIYAKRLQILKEAVPSMSKVAFLTPRRAWEGSYGQAFQPAYQDPAAGGAARQVNARAAAGFEVSSGSKTDRRARNAFCPPPHRDPRRRCGGVFAPDGGG
jgi:putative ABC transport system substrate-binding protein